MSVTHGAGCHGNVTLALKEMVAARHNVARALAAFAEAKGAPNEWHRNIAMQKVFAEIDAAEARLTDLIENVPGIRPECRRMMVKVDGIVGDVRAWAATLAVKPAKVIDFPVRRAPAKAARRSRAKNRPEVNPNLCSVSGDAPAAC